MYFNNEEIEEILNWRKKNEKNRKTLKEQLEDFENEFERHNLSDSEKNHIYNKILFTNGKIENNPSNLKCPICNGKYVAKTHYTLQGIAYYMRKRMLTEEEKEEERIRKSNRMLEKTDVAEKEEDFRDYFCLHCGAKWNGEKEDIIEHKEYIEKEHNSMIKEKLQEKYKTKFTPQIIFRGREYFNNGNVTKVYKDKENEQYISRVIGSNLQIYDVQIILEEGEAKMTCTCPCIDNCKHEYATLMMIDNNKYSTINLLPIEEDEEVDIKQLINSIPNEKIKEYLIYNFEIENYIYDEKFKEDFRHYLPEKSKDYFYNRLFNGFQLDNVNIKEFLDIAKLSLENGKNRYTFIITSAIIDAFKETKYIDSEGIMLNNYNTIGTFIRIAYRKGNEELKNEINEWIAKYENNNYYNDIYLEDMIIGIR